jgi:hypothetical protein
MSEWTLQEWQAVIAIIADIVTTLAVIFAGVWTYLLFVRHRERYPRAAIEQVASAVILDDRSILIRVQIRVKNIGKVLLPIEDLECRLQQIVPVLDTVKARLRAGEALVIGPGTTVDWPMLSEAAWRYQRKQSEIEPCEAEIFCCDFVVDRSVRCVRIYSHLANQSKAAAMGWTCSTDLNLSEGVSDAQSSET